MNSKQFKNYILSTITPQGWELITEFFITFARFECALKKSTFVQIHINSVSPNWDRFINSIESHFNKSSSKELEKACDYLLHNPPRTQTYTNGQLSWRNRTFSISDSEIFKIKTSICDIRNNLFHGGKFQGKFEEDISRNYILLNHSIVILNEWLKLDSDVNRNFSEPIS